MHLFDGRLIWRLIGAICKLLTTKIILLANSLIVSNKIQLMIVKKVLGSKLIVARLQLNKRMILLHTP